jgi:ATP-dependent 26S proteasome regulatory subunit
VISAVERNVIDHARAAEGLVRRGQSARKGVLLHGPPGTGKTHTIRWLISALPDHTTLLIPADQVCHLDEYLALARLLQPALVVIEDVDLIARERTQMRNAGQESLLNKLLNEMDGLRADARITFILTTNRPEDIEPAVAARPGRVVADIAIDAPYPRGSAFRTTTVYNDWCRVVSQSLGHAMDE